MSPQIYTFVRQTKSFLNSHHLVLFIAVLGLLLSAGIFSLSQVLVIIGDAPVASSTIGGFDQKTVDKIKNLQDSKNVNTTLQLPAGRPVPFTE